MDSFRFLSSFTGYYGFYHVLPLLSHSETAGPDRSESAPSVYVQFGDLVLIFGPTKKMADFRHPVVNSNTRIVIGRFAQYLLPFKRISSPLEEAASFFFPCFDVA